MRQAIWAVRKTLTDWVLNLPVSVWYDIRDDGVDATNQEHNFGLVDYNLQPKPALLALRTLNWLAQNGSYVGLLDQTPVGLHIMKIARPEVTTFVAWQELVGRSTRIGWPSSLGVSAVGMLGNTIQPVCSGSACAITVSESAGLVYLTFASSAF